MTKTKVLMRAEVELEPGTVLMLPFNMEVHAGPPTDWKRIHDKYCGQNCTFVKVEKQSGSGSYSCILKVQFQDGYEASAFAEGFVYVGPPSNKKEETAGMTEVGG